MNDILQDGQTYHAVVVKDGFVSIQTTAENFAVNLQSVGEEIENQL
jgi:hypothetical protein